MYNCSPLVEEDPHSWYFTSMYLVFLLTVLVNSYVLYCIIYRSTKAMSTYRWYLLWNQGMVSICGCVESLLAQPVYYLPFQMIYLGGLLRGIVPTWVIVYLTYTLLFICCSTISHLFIYRYTVIREPNRFAFVFKMCAALPYLSSLAITVQLVRSFPYDQSLIEEYAQSYTCISPDLLNITGFFVADRELLYYNCAYTVKFTSWVICIEVLVSTVASLWATSLGRNKSSQRNKMQRKLLVQLIVQTVTPIVVIIIPTQISNQTADVWSNSAFLTGQIGLVSLSSYSIVSGISIIALNPVYRRRTRRITSQSMPQVNKNSFNRSE